LVARAFGAKNPREADHFRLQCLIAGELVSIPVVVAGILFAPVIVAPFSPTREVQELGASFVSTIFVSTPLLFIIFLSTAALRALVDAMTRLILAVVENLINFAINYT